MQNLLNIIDKIYSSEYFSTALIIAIVVLIVLFVLVFIMGVIDNKKEEIRKMKENDQDQEITFSEIKEEDKIKEDITFEQPSITKNLEDFKTSLEEELNQGKDSLLPLEKSQKPYRVLEVSEIEDTTIIPKIDKEELEKTLILPKINSDLVKTEEDKIQEGSDYLKQNIFGSTK